MVLIKICLLGCMILICRAGSTNDSQNPTNNEKTSFETAHKISNFPDNFQSSHKITNYPYAEHKALETDDENLISPLMQLQQTQNLWSTKERPELNPILSAIINEDVMKSIEAKRAIEKEQFDAVVASEKTEPSNILSSTEILPIVLTTPKEDLLEYKQNTNLVDKQTSLFAAGSENQKSRIQIKKGPNGMDYEYEYVYYYYDDDEEHGGGAGGIANKQQEAESALVSETSKRGAQSLERGKSRYTNVERSTTSAPDNALESRKAKGHSNSQSPSSNDIEDGRLPVLTRFPSRVNEVHPTTLLDNISNSANEKNEKNKKISIKHPSLELVDSETFNTDEKQTKGSPRNGDSEKITSAVKLVNESANTETKSDEKKKDSDKTMEDVEQTTPVMEKAALDLYAILAKENLEMDMTTDFDKDLTTIIPTEIDNDTVTTMALEEETSTLITSPTPSITTTTESTTTSTTTELTTSTVNTTPTFLVGSGRRGLPSAGRNRFRLKSSNTDATTSTTEASIAPAGESQSKISSGLKRNRFQRPSFGNRKTVTLAPASSSNSAEKEIIGKETDKPVESSHSLRGRTRNRFSLRGQISTTTESTSSTEQEQNDEINKISTSTGRSQRVRPTLNIRGRSRIGTRPITTTQTPVIAENNEAAISDSSTSGTGNEKTSSVSPLQTKPSRLNSNRAAPASGANRLLPRSRLNTLRTTTPIPPELSSEISSEGKDDLDIVGGINKPKSRIRPVQPKTDNKPKATSAIAVARKPNPLLARRKLAIGGSTTESIVDAEEQHSDENGDSESNSSTSEEAKAEGNTDLPETTTKRILGLITPKKRLPLRKPGSPL